MTSKTQIFGISSLGLGLLLLIVIGISSYRSAGRLINSTYSVSQTLEVIGNLRRVNADWMDAENNWRGYALYGEQSELARTRDAMARLAPELAETRRLLLDNPQQLARLDKLDESVFRGLELLERALALTRSDPAQLTIHKEAEVVANGRRQLVLDMEGEERQLLLERRQTAAAGIETTKLIVVTGFLLALLLVALAVGLGQWEILRRLKAEKALSSALDNLALNLNEAEERGRERATLSELAARLQSCRSLSEGLPFMSRGMKQLFPEESGSILIFSPSRNVLETVTSWGNHAPTAPSFPPDDCWALRNGRLQVVDAEDSVLRCAHLHADAGRDAICLPLVGQGETLGLLCHCLPVDATQPSAARSEASSLNRVRLATLAGAQISLATANLQLRENLRNQSIRDVLTGLFNRRYMQESLAREFHRALRKRSPLAVMMIDVDHFKQFNDAYGHDLGDRLLREFGKFLSTNIRGEDIACRYGGEEFTLILPDAAAEGASRRAEGLRQAAAKLSIPMKAGGAANVTVSIGIALYPEHATTPDSLLEAADAALYRAKAEGRDRFVISQARVPA